MGRSLESLQFLSFEVKKGDCLSRQNEGEGVHGKGEGVHGKAEFVS